MGASHGPHADARAAAAAPRPRDSILPWRHALAASILLALCGCASLAPRYEAPRLPVPDAWLDSAQGVSGHAAPVLAWNDYFTDPVLKQLIQTALDNNRDLRVALLRVEEARASYRIQRAELFPQVNAGARGTRARVPGDLNLSGSPVTSAEYRAEIGASSWELDLWGRVRNLDDSALQQWLATQAGSRAARMALIAQVADAYLGVRDVDERLALARRTVETRQETSRIFNRRFEVGAISKLDLTQVQLLLNQAQTLLAQLEQARATQVHALGLLIGAHPGPLPEAAPFDETMELAELAPGLPSELLTARPDIVAAEHRLIAAHADIGAARAAFFPRIALTGSLGTASAELDGLFSSGSRAWSFAPVISLPIFDGGRRRANLELSEVRRDIAVAEYEKSIQTAFREVSDALSARRWLTEQRDLQRTALVTARERARLAQLRYDNGSVAYLEVLDAQRELLSAEQQLVQARRALLSNQVSLYAALGGGTQSGPRSTAAPGSVSASPR
ncbi:efflux transporter outer membrane subunit [Rhodanobacter sp. PCA2]|uniref:efflux transporter outer membrane subunit n=1 Tax=Rhodanobacter sp. PCA2 TaxID=2006117 RepID=UPI0015E79F71|nr:efflux transporter outer membrane subunit [Rhodanobacter sp. PCA2]MBA2077263.1 RND transporter [Rhodanobacter sp. PCA2]